MNGLDQLKYRIVSVNIGLDQLILVWISYYWSRLFNISLDGLNIKNYWLMLLRISIANYRLILTNYRLRVTKTEYVVV